MVAGISGHAGASGQLPAQGAKCDTGDPQSAGGRGRQRQPDIPVERVREARESASEGAKESEQNGATAAVGRPARVGKFEDVFGRAQETSWFQVRQA